MWALYALLSAVFAAVMTILIKLGLKNVDLYLATAIRVSIVTIICWGIVFFQGAFRHWKAIDSKNMIYLIASGLATGASWLFYYYGLKIGPASKVSAIDKLSVVFVTIMAVFLIGEVVTWKTAIGIGLITLGTIIVIFS